MITDQRNFFGGNSLTHEMECLGFSVIPDVLAADQQKALLEVLGPVSGAGRRGLLSLPAVANLARSGTILELLRPHMRSEPFPVRAIYFDKNSETNWLVPWHQDLTIAVRSLAEVPGFGPWSEKDGIPHVQPPIEFLQEMLTIRLHLDDADESNGALRLLPGSHRRGRLLAGAIQTFRQENQEYICAMTAGDALLMRPLLLHASSRSARLGHRRVLHIEYAGFALPGGLEWNDPA